MTSNIVALITRLNGWQTAPKISPAIDGLMSDVSEAATELTTLLQRVEKAEARADLADEDAKKLADRWQNEVGLREEMERRYGGILERVELAERQRDAALKALEPFAKEAERLRNYPDDYPYGFPTTPITVGHLRAARNAMGEPTE